MMKTVASGGMPQIPGMGPIPGGGGYGGGKRQAAKGKKKSSGSRSGNPAKRAAENAAIASGATPAGRARRPPARASASAAARARRRPRAKRSSPPCRSSSAASTRPVTRPAAAPRSRRAGRSRAPGRGDRARPSCDRGVARLRQPLLRHLARAPVVGDHRRDEQAIERGAVESRRAVDGRPADLAGHELGVVVSARGGVAGAAALEPPAHRLGLRRLGAPRCGPRVR